MNDYAIRKARPDDMKEIINLCAEHAAYEEEVYSREGMQEKLSAFLFAEKPALHCLVAAAEDELIGYATYMFEFSTWDAAYYVHMDCLYLPPHARGQGIGESLIKEIAKAAKENNCSQVQWHTPASNERAINFYYKMGAVSKAKLRLYLDENAIKIFIK